MANFPVTRLPEGTNDRFCVMVELATTISVGRYTCGEHKVCFEVLPNRGRVNQVFECAGVPYGPHLEPGVTECPQGGVHRPGLA
jgi:hypothetical protein